MEEEILIYSSIDSIYMNIEKIPKSIMIMLWLLFFLSILNETTNYSNFNLLSYPRQAYYCFNPYSQTLELCDLEQLCPKNKYVKHLYLYIKNETFSTSNFIEELEKVNSNYLLFFKTYYKDIISKIYDSIGKEINLYDQSKLGIVLTKYENTLMISYERLCNNASDQMLNTIFVVLSIFWGDIVLNIFSDIYGRFKVLIISLIFLSVGCCGIVVFDLVINKKINEKSKDFNKEYFYFSEELNINDYHDNMLNEFAKYKILLFMSLFIIYVGQSSLNSMSLCLILEFSLNDRQVHKNFLFHFIGKALSIFFSFAISCRTSEIFQIYLVLGIMSFILMILCFIFFYESPRYYYEYSDYYMMSKTIFSIFPSKDLMKYTNDNKEKSIKLISSEISQYENDKLRELYELEKKYGECITEWTILCNSFYLNKRKSLRGGSNYISKEEIMSKPFLLITHMFMIKFYKNNILLILSIFFLIKINYNIVLLQILSPSFYTREDIYKLEIFNSPRFYVTIIILLSNYVFYLIIKFFSFKINFFICFSFLFIISFIGDIPSFYLPHYNMNDRNQFDYSKITLELISNQKDLNKIILYALSFFVNGIHFSLYFMIFKYTKTLYRSTFFGITNFFFKLCFSVSYAYVYLLKHTFLVLSIFNFIGLIITFFIDDVDHKFDLVTDKKNLEIAENHTYQVTERSID